MEDTTKQHREDILQEILNDLSDGWKILNKSWNLNRYVFLWAEKNSLLLNFGFRGVTGTRRMKTGREDEYFCKVYLVDEHVANDDVLIDEVTSEESFADCFEKAQQKTAPALKGLKKAIESAEF